MAASFPCGDTSLLKGLLDDRLPPDVQAGLTAHLETCGVCRSAFDALAAGNRWWGELREFVPPDRGPGPTLPMDAAHRPEAGEPTRAGDGSGPGPGEDDDMLGVLDPPTSPGHLGRFGPYDVTGLLGRGGMGVVLMGFDPALHRPVAIKLLAPRLATSSTARRRFLREARAAASVVHEHVVTIHAVGEAGGLPFLVMQYVPGKSLQERIDAGGPLGLKEILRVGMQAAAGLAAAHAQGLVHRDVKPANILLENGVERVKLTDFGLARAVDDAALTQSGVIAGTPQYMAPEQVRGDAVDHRADLFSLGSVLYAMCTGRSPFRAETTVAVLRRVCDEAPRPVREIRPEVPDWLEALIAKLHSKDPAARYQTAAEVSERLGRHLALLQEPSHPGSAPPEDPDIPAGKTPPRHRTTRRPAFAALALLALTCGGLALAEATGVAKVSDLLATVLRVAVPQGTLVIESGDPDVAVDIDGGGVSIRGAGFREVHLRPGNYQVRATRNGVPVLAELVTISRGGKRVVKVGLEAPRPAPGVAAKSTPVTRPRSDPPAPALVLQGLGSEALALAFAPDGKTLAAGYNNGTVVLWDTAQARPRMTFQGPAQAVLCLAYSRDGKALASCTGYWKPDQPDGEVDLWDAETGRSLDRLRGHKGSVYWVAFAPDGREVVSVGADGFPRVWDLAGGTLRAVLTGHNNWVYAAAYAPDGKTIAIAGGDMTVHLADAATCAPQAVLRGHTGQIECVAFSPDGKTIASGGRDNLIKLWDVVTHTSRTDLRGHTGWVSALAYSPDGAILASAALAAGSKEVKLWDVASGRVLATLDRINSHAVVYAPDGKSIATGDFHGDVKLWDVAKLLDRGPGAAASPALTPARPPVVPGPAP